MPWVGAGFLEGLTATFCPTALSLHSSAVSSRPQAALALSPPAVLLLSPRSSISPGRPSANYSTTHVCL
ncbi:hypothetical protein MHYP_G00161580 [Metynnis hypsauchen]